MALYFLEYDLRKQRDYKKLNDELVNFGAVRILKSLWCFNRINTTSKNLREHFKQFIDKDDGLIVAEVNDWASISIDSSPNKLA
jgi:hypothetical protein